MSTKAYGYFITDLSVFDAADRIRETIVPVFLDRFRQQQERLSERLQENINATWDETFLADLPSDNQRILHEYITDYSQCDTYALARALYKRMTELKNSAKRTLSDVDIFYDVQIMRGPEDNTIVFKVFSECRDYTEALETRDWCRDFSYWDNADPDENISEEEWEQRKHYWDSNDPAAPLADVSLSISQPSEILTIMCYINSRSWCRTAH